MSNHREHAIVNFVRHKPGIDSKHNDYLTPAFHDDQMCGKMATSTEDSSVTYTCTRYKYHKNIRHAAHRPDDVQIASWDEINVVDPMVEDVQIIDGDY